MTAYAAPQQQEGGASNAEDVDEDEEEDDEEDFDEEVARLERVLDLFVTELKSMDMLPSEVRLANTRT